MALCRAGLTLTLQCHGGSSGIACLRTTIHSRVNAICMAPYAADAHPLVAQRMSMWTVINRPL